MSTKILPQNAGMSLRQQRRAYYVPPDVHDSPRAIRKQELEQGDSRAEVLKGGAEGWREGLLGSYLRRGPYATFLPFYHQAEKRPLPTPPSQPASAPGTT